MRFPTSLLLELRLHPLNCGSKCVFILAEGEPDHHQVLPVLRIEVEYVWWNGSNSDFVD
jgi:hypothetical protein